MLGYSDKQKDLSQFGFVSSKPDSSATHLWTIDGRSSSTTNNEWAISDRSSRRKTSTFASFEEDSDEKQECMIDRSTTPIRRRGDVRRGRDIDHHYSPLPSILGKRKFATMCRISDPHLVDEIIQRKPIRINTDTDRLNRAIHNSPVIRLSLHSLVYTREIVPVSLADDASNELMVVSDSASTIMSDRIISSSITFHPHTSADSRKHTRQTTLEGKVLRAEPIESNRKQMKSDWIEIFRTVSDAESDGQWRRDIKDGFVGRIHEYRLIKRTGVSVLDLSKLKTNVEFDQKLKIFIENGFRNNRDDICDQFAGYLFDSQMFFYLPDNQSIWRLIDDDKKKCVSQCLITDMFRSR